MATPSETDWGYGESDGSYHTILSLSVAPANATGDLEVAAKLCDRLERRNRCEAVFRTTYSEVETFALALKAVMKRVGEEAVLIGRTND